MTTKNPSKTRTTVAQRDFITTLTAEEKEASTTVPETHDRLAVARANLVLRETAREAAEDHAAAVRASFKDQDETHTALDYAVANAEVERATAMASGARRELTEAENGLRHDDTTLASLVGSVVNELLRGVAVHPTFLDYRAAPAQDDRPVCLIVQTQPTKFAANGSLSGDLVLRFHYIAAVHRGLDDREFEKACQDRGFLVEVGHAYSRAEGTDEMKVRVRSAFDGAPHLPTLDPKGGLDYLGRQLAENIATSKDYGNHPVTGDPRNGFVRSSHFACMPHEATVVSERVDADGVRTTVAEVCVLLRVLIEAGAQHLDAAIFDALAGFRRKPFVAGLGVVESTPEVVTSSDLDIEPQKVTLALDRAQGVSSDAKTYAGYLTSADRQVTVRFVLTSTVGTDANSTD